VSPKAVAVFVTTGDTLFGTQLVQYVSYVTTFPVNGNTRDHYVSSLHAVLCERDQVTPVFRSSPWLPVKYRIGYKTKRVVCKALNGLEQ